MNNVVAPDASTDTTRLSDPIPQEYRFIPPGKHHARVLFALAVVGALIGLLVALQERPATIPMLVCGGAAPFLLLGYIARRFHASEQIELTKIRDGAYLWFWPLTEAQSTAYRRTRHRKRRKVQICCLLIPWVLAMVGAVVFGFWNIIDGRQVRPTLELSGALAVLATAVFGGSFVLWWVWSIPRRAALNARLLPIVFAKDSIRIADLQILSLIHI